MIRLADPLLWAALAFLAIFAGLGVMLYGLVNGPRARLKRRINGLVLAGGGRFGQSGELSSDLQMRRKMVSGKLKELDASRRRKGGQSLRRTLGQAGLSLTAGRFLALSALAGLGTAVLLLLVGLPPVAAIAFGIIAGVGLPRLALQSLVKRRVGKFTAGFADAIDIVVRGIRSGLPVGEAFNIIVQEMPDPIQSEFRIVVESQKMGLTLDEALSRACDRVPTAELRFFSIVLAIQQSTGGNLAETLAKLSEVLRARKRMRDKVQAMSSEAKASAMIIGSLPPLVAALLAVVSPHYIGVLFTSSVGHLILFGGAALMSVGVLVMRRMINFDI
jgi:tight adherence protein B